MSKPQHLLLIDADTVEAYAWARLLDRHRFRVSVATDGAAAVARHASDPADAVIVDAMTADLPSLAAAMRQQTPGLAILAIVEPQQSGPADATLVKPVDANDLVANVQRLLGRPESVAPGMAPADFPR